MPFQWQATRAEHSCSSCLGDGLRRPQQEMGPCWIESWPLQGDHQDCVDDGDGGVGDDGGDGGDGESDSDDGDGDGYDGLRM